MNEEAKSRGLRIEVQSDFRAEGGSINNTIREPALKSRHKVGRALDINLSKDGKWFNSDKLNNKDKLPKGISEFIDSIEATKVTSESDKDSKVIWGGRWSGKNKDSVHFQLKMTDKQYSQLYKENQLQIQGKGKPIEVVNID